MEIEVINNVTMVTNKPKLIQAIGDTGTTGNFVLPGAPVDDTKVAIDPIGIEMETSVLKKTQIRATCGSQDCQKNEGRRILCPACPILP